MALTGQLENVLEKTKRLVELCEALQEENDLLKQENQTLRITVDTGKSKTIELEEKLKALKLARSLEDISGAKAG